MTSIVSVHEARKNLSGLMSEAFYADRPFVLTRGKKAMAALIGVKLLTKMFAIIEKHDPGLADTIAIMANPEIQALLEESGKNIAKGQTIPIKEILKD